MDQSHVTVMFISTFHDNLRGHSVFEVASLGMLPDPSRELLLAAFAQSVE
jgi:hypothetical protein